MSRTGLVSCLAEEYTWELEKVECCPRFWFPWKFSAVLQENGQRSKQRANRSISAIHKLATNKSLNISYELYFFYFFF